MWRQIGKIISKAIEDWGTTARMCSCIAMVTLCAVVILWARAQIQVGV